jgi:hypothetical protein
MTDRPRAQYVVVCCAGLPQPHYDLVFEPTSGAAGLEAWRVQRWPPAFGPAPAQKLPKHPRTYLDGGRLTSLDGGRVTRVEKGTASKWMSTGGEWGLRLIPHRRWWQRRRLAISLTFTPVAADQCVVSGQAEPSRLPPR